MAEHELLTPAEVAVMFRVEPKTVSRWARAGKLSAIRTVGGHRRFRASDIQRFVGNAAPEERAWEPPTVRFAPFPGILA
jgi:excisionase family DNA binding protein